MFLLSKMVPVLILLLALPLASWDLHAEETWSGLMQESRKAAEEGRLNDSLAAFWKCLTHAKANF